MENVTGAITRIRAIEARVRPDVPAGGFHQVLAAAGARTATAGGTDGSVRTATVADRIGANGTVTLGQLLGRPVTPGASAEAVRGAPAVAGSAASAEAGSSTGAHRPVVGRVSSEFGMRTHPVTGVRKSHTGIDFAAPTGTPIEAAAAGTVTFAGVRGGYGNLVIVDHGDGTETRYAHQHRIDVGVGQQVQRGQQLGTVGSTGMSTGPHLHFEVRRDGTPIDPRPWLSL